MSDYGQQLRFGSFLTPTSADPHRVVALAERSEQVGLDLVTFQDHPYQPALLDAWTLLSYVAARTERIRLAPNVLNLPLRPPAVVARAAAGLDLLSGGRVDLALGAGAFWDAMVAMGAPRRTPGESITALTEAISVIRTIWDTETRGGVRLEGDFYPVTGAKRGPPTGASDRDLARRVQTADAPADRSGSRRLAAVDGLPATRAFGPGAREPSTRRLAAPGATRGPSGGCTTSTGPSRIVPRASSTGRRPNGSSS